MLNTKKTTKIIQDDIMKLLNDVLIDFEPVQLFAIAGTALGCVRHRNIIPWDDDVDLGMDSSHIPLFEKIVKEKGYKITSQTFGFKIWRNNVFIDIFLFTNRDNKYAYQSDLEYTNWKREYFNDRNEVYPLMNLPFGSLNIPSPNRIHEYVDHAYPGFQKIAKYKHPHFMSKDVLQLIIFYINPFIPKTWELH
jgi:lipopolysaccharide cholinephosphotransferase